MVNKNGISPLEGWARRNIKFKNELVAHSVAEFIGTFILVLFAVGARSQHKLQGDSFAIQILGDVFGLLLAITAVGGISGAHINPIVSFSLAFTGQLEWIKVPAFWVGQLAGGYLGSGVGFSIYRYEFTRKYGGNLTSVTDIINVFSPYPGVRCSEFMVTGFGDQVLCSSMLLIAVLSSADQRNMAIPKWFLGVFFAFLVAGVNFAFGYNAGAVMNPAKDFGPRLMAVTLGWSPDEVFMFKDEDGELHHYWMIQLFAPFIGAVLGTLTYTFFIGCQLEPYKVQGQGNRVELDLYSRKSLGQPEDWTVTTTGFPPPDSYLLSATGSPLPIVRRGSR